VRLLAIRGKALQRHPRRIHFRHPLVLASPGADYRTIDDHLYGELLVVVRPLFLNRQIKRWLPIPGLNQLLKPRFVVPSCHLLLSAIDLALEKPENEVFGTGKSLI